MNEIKFTCPICGQKISSDSANAGTVLNCPSCQNHIGVPRGFDDTTPPNPPPAALSTPPPPRTGPTSALAVASLICSLSSLVTCIGWLPGIICGHLARAKIRRNPSLRGRGCATAGLVIGYATLALTASLVTVGIARFGSAIKQQYQQVSQQMRLAMTSPGSPALPVPVEVVSNTAPPVDNAPPAAEPPSFGWNLDLKDTPFPDSPVSGKLHGLDFTVKRVIFANGNLRINSTTAGMSVTITGLGSSIETSSREISPTTGGGAPVIEINWNDDGQAGTAKFASGYALKLKIDPAAKRKIRGQIYLCLPDDSNSYIAGTFAVTFPKKKPAQ